MPKSVAVAAGDLGCLMALMAAHCLDARGWTFTAFCRWVTRYGADLPAVERKLVAEALAKREPARGNRAGAGRPWEKWRAAADAVGLVREKGCDVRVVKKRA